MTRSFRLAALGSIMAIGCIPTLRASDIQYQVLRAGNAHELIADMFIAARSGQPTQIRLAQGHYVFSSAIGTAFDGSYLPVVTTTVQIIGSDAAKTVLENDQSSWPHRFLAVAKGGNLSVYKVTLSGGAEACESNDCRNEGGGAAINAGGRLEFHDCILSSNNTWQVEGDEIEGGGAILNLAGTLLLDRTTLMNNGAMLFGGAIFLRAGSGTISNSIISSSFVRFNAFGRYAAGAAIFVHSGAKLNISGSTISDSSGGESYYDGSLVSGLGIYNSGNLTITNSAVIDNVDEGSEVLSSASAGAGGGIFNNGTARIVNTTVSGNSVGTLGGGIYNGGTLVLQGTTITDNTVYGAHGFRGIDFGFPDGCTLMTWELCLEGGAGIWNEPSAVVSAATSVLAANRGNDCHGVLTTVGFNAVGSLADCTLKRSPSLGPHASYDLVNLDVRLGEREDEGIAGNVHYTPLSDSPLIDAGGPVGRNCTPLDQMGQRRVEGDADPHGAWFCDIGAIEYQPPRHP